MRRIGTMLLLFTAALTVVARKTAEQVKTYTPERKLFGKWNKVRLACGGCCALHSGS